MLKHPILAFIFDFDGVIADSTGAMLQVIDDFAEQRGIQRVPRCQMANLTLLSILARLGVKSEETSAAVQFARD